MDHLVGGVTSRCRCCRFHEYHYLPNYVKFNFYSVNPYELTIRMDYKNWESVLPCGLAIRMEHADCTDSQSIFFVYF